MNRHIWPQFRRQFDLCDHPMKIVETITDGTQMPIKPTASPRIIVLMGVSGTGKSTLGAALAATTQLPFIDGDDLHPQENVAKMARGEALGDADRVPWLEAVRAAAEKCVQAQMQARESESDADSGSTAHDWRPGVVVACSALKQAYRAALRGGAFPTYVVYLEGEREVLMARLEARQGHFFKAEMLQSQLDALESPEGETGVVSVSVALSTAAQVQRVVVALESV